MHLAAVTAARLAIGALGALLAPACGIGAARGGAATVEPPRPEMPKLHVPSPGWRDQIVYFLMIDRFDDGDPGNNDQGAGEYDPGSNAKYSGGDLQGVARRLDYIKGLGATAVWITPPVANQWWNGSYGGYHGYWAENFMAVDAHYGTLDDYRRLSHAIHTAGMYLVQDVVVNHTGNFFGYRGGWDPGDPVQHFTPNADSRPVPAPTQWPFSLNDARDPQQRNAAIYHWTPAIADFTDETQEQRFQLADLDDLNTENPVVRAALRESYGWWIREVGVDAFRVDTAFHVPPEFFADFLYSHDAEHPGVIATAKRTGRENFHAFGEGFGIDKPYADDQARKLERYMRSPDGAALLPGMINFPLYGSALDVFARGRPTAELGHRIRSTMRTHARPHLMPSFVDNHDVDRFLAGGSQAGLKQGLLLIMTLPGIPTIYYGTEQAFTQQRAAMFAGGFGSDGRDRFDTHAPLYRFIQRATALRRAHPLFSRGVPTVLKDNAAAPGALAYRMTHGDASALVAFNSADTDTLLDNLNTDLAPGTVLESLFGIDATPGNIVVGADGRITLKLPPRSGLVWKAAGTTTAAAPSTVARLELAALKQAKVNRDFVVSGAATGVQRFKLVVDGDLAGAQTVTPAPDGRWQATIDTAGMIDPAIEHSVVAWSEAPAAVSGSRRFRVERQWTVLAERSDPPGDDRGPDGRYTYPKGTAWRTQRPADIRGVRVSGSGGSLKVDVELTRVIAAWNPPNGFDHVALTLFIQMPGEDGGATVQPLQNTALPGGMRWHYRLRANGWTNALFAAEGASPTHEGMSVSPGADLRVDRERSTITFTLPATALGRPASLSGLKLYLNTWDYDGGYRPLGPDLRSHGFSGGGARDPLIMDDTGVIVLP